MDYATLTKLVDNERKNTSGVNYTSIDERFKGFNATQEDISEVERNIKHYSPAVQKKMYEAIEKSGW